MIKYRHLSQPYLWLIWDFWIVYSSNFSKYVLDRLDDSREPFDRPSSWMKKLSLTESSSSSKRIVRIPLWFLLVNWFYRWRFYLRWVFLNNCEDFGNSKMVLQSSKAKQSLQTVLDQFLSISGSLQNPDVLDLGTCFPLQRMNCGLEELSKFRCG